jgi:hypothetical protein
MHPLVANCAIARSLLCVDPWLIEMSDSVDVALIGEGESVAVVDRVADVCAVASPAFRGGCRIKPWMPGSR